MAKRYDNTTNHIHVENVREAWEVADKIFPTDYMKDDQSSNNAGYPIYRSTAEGMTNFWYNTICDLGCRLEVNLCDEKWNSRTTNIWIDFVERTSNGYRICGSEI